MYAYTYAVEVVSEMWMAVFLTEVRMLSLVGEVSEDQLEML